jgi:hypothetical protein
MTHRKKTKKTHVEEKTEDTKIKKSIMSFKPSSIETIDYALFDWLNDTLDISCTTNKGWKKVPLVWVAGERSWQIKAHKDLRDIDGALIFPIMTLQRQSMVKDPTKKGMFYGNIPPVKDKKGGSILIARRIQQDKTATFLNADSARKSNRIVGTGQINFPNKKANKKIVYESISIPMPVYVDVSYLISVRTEYQQQMNEIIQPFVTKTGGINYTTIKRDGHQYELFMQSDFTENNNITEMGDETRIYESTMTFKILGYLVGAEANQEQPQIVIRENAVSVAIPRERTIFKDELPWRHGNLPE